jgi:MYXO-CTERM domain-containing protein
MNIRFVSLLVLGAVVGVGVAAPAARATIVYQYVADISSFTGAPGSAVPPINVYLQQTVSGGSSDLLLSRSGLRSAGFSLSRPGNPADGGAYISGVSDQTASGGSFAGGTPFTPVAFPVVSFGNTETVSAAAVTGPLGNLNGSVRTILLATMSLTVGNVVSTFTLGARDLSNTNTVFFTQGADNGLDLDSALGTPFQGASDLTFSIIINPTPAPGAAALLALGGLLATRRRRS